MRTTSVYSGKCDVYDTLVMIHEVEDFSKVKIYHHFGDVVPLRIDSKKDLAPFYPFLTSMMISSGDEITIILSSKSFVDIEEAEWLQWKLDDLLRYWRRCQRKEQPFDRDEAERIVSWRTGDKPESHVMELIDRVEELGDKATVEDIHDSMHDMMRKELMDEMIRLGWDEDVAYKWCFGFERWLKREG